MGLAAGSVAWLDCLYAENDTSRCAQQAPVQPSCRLQRQAAHARTSCTMTAAQSGAAGPPEGRKRSTVALVALSACVALLAYAVTYRAPVLRAAPEVVPTPAPGECSCNVRERCCVVGVGTRLSAARLATQAPDTAPTPPFVSDVRSPLRAGPRSPPQSTLRRLPQGLQELTGTVEDCCCDFETVDRLNEVRRRCAAASRCPHGCTVRRFREPHAKRRAGRRCCTRCSPS